MQRYFIYLAYDGSRYHGWQIQPNGISVQQTLNEALTTLLRHNVEVTGAGRTDAGVHASLMVAHFDSERVSDTAFLKDKLNRLLPPDIMVYNITEVHPEAHARFDATSRTYYYYVTMDRYPFGREYKYHLYKAPDFDLMNRAAQLLIKYEDFTSFSKLHTDVKTNICHITQAYWSKEDERTWKFTITADRFLRNMVRAIVGTLLDVGMKKISINEFVSIIEGKNRCLAGSSAPGNALFLADITYPSSISNFEKGEEICG